MCLLNPDRFQKWTKRSTHVFGFFYYMLYCTHVLPRASHTQKGVASSMNITIFKKIFRIHVVVLYPHVFLGYHIVHHLNNFFFRTNQGNF